MNALVLLAMLSPMGPVLQNHDLLTMEIAKENENGNAYQDSLYDFTSFDECAEEFGHADQWMCEDELLELGGYDGRNSKKVVKIRRMWLREKTYNLVFNFSRIISGHQPLIQGLRLNRAAWKHSKWMAEQNRGINHRDFYDRSERYNFDAENVAGDYSSIFGALFGWINSKGHRKNMYAYSHLFHGTGFAKRVEIYYVKNKKGRWVRDGKKKTKFYTQVFR